MQRESRWQGRYRVPINFDRSLNFALTSALSPFDVTFSIFKKMYLNLHYIRGLKKHDIHLLNFWTPEPASRVVRRARCPQCCACHVSVVVVLAVHVRSSSKRRGGWSACVRAGVVVRCSQASGGCGERMRACVGVVVRFCDQAVGRWECVSACVHVWLLAARVS